MKCFFDTEFTGLVQNTTLISLAIVAENGACFYAISEDFEAEKCSDFVQQTVLPYLEIDIPAHQGSVSLSGTKEQIAEALHQWFAQFDTVQMWADVPHYDWVLFCDVFGGAFHIPKHIHYMCMDLSTLLFAKGYDIDTPRKDLITKTQLPKNYIQHNALSDAQVGMQILLNLLKT